jgi:hypothetical protein
MTAKQFTIKSHKFKAADVIISDLEETQNGKPVLRLKYNYGGETGIGPFNIQMDEKVVKMGITGMIGDTPTPVSEVTQDSLSLSFSDNEAFTAKELHFINEIAKLEDRIIDKLVPLAPELFNIDEALGNDVIRKMIKFNRSVKYSTFKDKNGKKTRERDHKFTSLRLKMYKNKNDNGELYYQGSYTDINKQNVTLTLDNHSEIVPKYCKVKTIMAIRNVWIVETTGAGLVYLPDKLQVTELSQGYTQNEFEDDSDNEIENLTTKTGKVELTEGPDETEELTEPAEIESQDDEEADIDDLIQTTPVVVPEPKKRRTTGKKI